MNKPEKSVETQEQLAYLRAQQSVLEMVEGPDYSAGDKIPSERVLCEQFGISRMTMRKALNNLVNKGVLERRGTAGTFVSQPRVQRPISEHTSSGITEMVHKTGGKAGSTLLFFESAQASGRVAEKLQIQPGSTVIVIRRLRTVDDVPFCIETCYLPAERVPGLIAADLLTNHSLYGLLKNRYGISADHAEGMIGVSMVTKLEADLLGLAPESSAMIYKGVQYDKDGKPIEYVTSANHPQRVIFTIADGSRPKFMPNQSI